MIEFCDAFAKPESAKLRAICAERVRLNDLRAGLDVRLMHAKDFFAIRCIQLIEATLVAYSVKQQRSHRAIGYEDGLPQSFIEIFDPHSLSGMFRMTIRLARLTHSNGAGYYHV